MRQATYIDPATRDAIRAMAFSYIATDVPEGLTLDEIRHAGNVRRCGRTSVRRRARRAFRRAATGFTGGRVDALETTAGGW